MAQPSSDPLDRIEGLLKAGKQSQARLLLMDFVRSNSASSQAWWLLSQAVTEPQQQIDCLRRVLKLEPGHAEAKEQLKFLEQVANQPGPFHPAPALVGSEPLPSTNRAASETAAEKELLPLPASTPVPSQPLAEITVSTKKPKKASFVLGLVLLLFVGSSVFMGYRYFKQQAQARQAAEQAEVTRQAEIAGQTQVMAMTPTSVPTLTLTASPTLTLTRTTTLTPTLTLTLRPSLTFSPPPAALMKPQVDFFAPAFKLTDAITGEVQLLSQFAGQPVLLIFCSTTSTPCKSESNTLFALYTNYHEKGLVMLAVYSQEKPEAVVAYQKSHQLAYRFLLDTDGSVKNIYAVYKLPVHFFIGRDGKIAAIETGLQQYATLAEQVKLLLP